LALGFALRSDTLQQTEVGRNAKTLADGAGHTFDLDHPMGAGQVAGSNPAIGTSEINALVENLDPLFTLNFIRDNGWDNKAKFRCPT
jgi:hypothetical protein